MAKKVFVGLSGGVDSAVSAALLKSQGYDVVGVFIKIWQPEFIECTWKEDRLDAMRVAAALEIPFREVDLSEEYKEKVIKDMLAKYAKGITPNPDVLCNQHIKFGDFAAWAFKNGADKIATGHYARVAEENGKHLLLRGADADKDQSYFLHSIDGAVLSRTVFPIGDKKKSEVRSLARRFQLPNAERPDSQGLCFVGDITLKEFLGRFITIAPGSVLDMTGKVIGSHDGAALYTVGQRHGFSIRTSKGESEVHYVVEVNAATNTLKVSEDKRDAARESVFLEPIHWIGGVPSMPFEAEVEVRYHATRVRARIEVLERGLRVLFKEPQIVSPGQSLVIYGGQKGEQCFGGGVMHF